MGFTQPLPPLQPPLTPLMSHGRDRALVKPVAPGGGRNRGRGRASDPGNGGGGHGDGRARPETRIGTPIGND